MIRLIRITGFLMIAAGAVVAASWLIKPLRLFWPWLMLLPLPIRIGVGIAAFGLLLLIGSLLHERFEEREQDRELRREE